MGKAFEGCVLSNYESQLRARRQHAMAEPLFLSPPTQVDGKLRQGYRNLLHISIIRNISESLVKALGLGP